jgi:uncharacterized protein YkwD
MPGRLPPSARLALPAVVAALAAPAADAAEPSGCSPAGTGRAAIECAIDAVRVAAGRQPLQSRPSLIAAARAHSSDMVERGYFAHESPGGAGPADRARRAGYMRRASAWRVGEVLLWSRGGALTAARAVELWLDSPKHRRILLGRRYRDVGVGLAAGAPAGNPGTLPATTLTVVVGRRR